MSVIGTVKTFWSMVVLSAVSILQQWWRALSSRTLQRCTVLVKVVQLAQQWFIIRTCLAWSLQTLTSAMTILWTSRRHETMPTINRIFPSSIFSVTISSNQETCTWVNSTIMAKLLSSKTVCATLISFFNKMQLIYSMLKATYSLATSIRTTGRVASSATETKKMRMAHIWW